MIHPLRMESIQSPIIPIVGELIRTHPGTISLGQGVVGYGPPREATDALAAFLAEPENHRYRPVDGIAPLRDALEAKLRRENGIRVPPASRLIVTAGGNMAFMNAVLAITDPGDEVILQTPYYFNHEMAIRLAACKPLPVPTDDSYQLQPRRIADAITPRTRAVVTISPNNPTGAVYPEAALREVNEICQEHAIYHISDEAYENFTYEGARHFSPGSLPGAGTHTISLYSMSKAYGMASWRIGYMVAPEQIFMSIKKIQDTILICPPVVSQHAAVGALQAGSDYCREKLRPLTEARRMVLDELGRIPLAVTIPATRGAFYLFPRVHTSLDAMAVTTRLIKEFRVAAIPGNTFGLTREAGDGCRLRIAYAALDKATLAEAIRRLMMGLEQIVAEHPE